MKKLQGAVRISRERIRQVEKEHYDESHDDEHVGGELAMAAALYASPNPIYLRVDFANEVHFRDFWPWEPHQDKRPSNGNVLLPNYKLKKKDRIRQLEMAGALIAAEIDRLLRLK